MWSYLGVQQRLHHGLNLIKLLSLFLRLCHGLVRASRGAIVDYHLWIISSSHLTYSLFVCPICCSSLSRDRYPQGPVPKKSTHRIARLKSDFIPCFHYPDLSRTYVGCCYPGTGPKGSSVSAGGDRCRRSWCVHTSGKAYRPP